MGKKCLRWMRYNFLKILRLKDGSEKIAKGVALGIAFNFLPTFGLGLFFAFIFAGLVRANQAAAVLSAILVKIGIPVFYLLNLAVGHLVIGDSVTADTSTAASLSLQHMQWGDLKHLGMPFLVGSVINAFWTGGLAYFLVLQAVEKYKIGRLRKNKT